MTLSSIESRHSPKCYIHQIADTLQSKKCETNDDRPKDEVNITSGKHHWHWSPDGTLVGQSRKSRKYCDASPSGLDDDGGIRKDERNHEKQNGEHQRRSSQTSNIQRTGDISHDGCPTWEEKLEKGLGLLGKNRDASPNPLNVSMFNTHERQTDRYCVDRQKESCNECEFTSEIKADLEKTYKWSTS